MIALDSVGLLRILVGCGGLLWIVLGFLCVVGDSCGLFRILMDCMGFL